MKKILLSTALLSATAGMAAAEVTFSGYGRFGLVYQENSGNDRDTMVALRMRLNINAKTETDSGVTFGGRIRMQYSAGDSVGGARLNAAILYATYEGVRVEVGNANDAYDSVALAYNSEIGFQDFGDGDPIFNFEAYSSGPYGSTPDRMGVFGSYSVGDLNVRASYITPDQTSSSEDGQTSISADYKFGSFTVAGAYMTNAGFDSDVSNLFLGAEYAISDVANVGILYFDVNDDFLANDPSKVTIYGNYKFDAITVKGFIASGENLGTEDTAYGIGVDYDLGGARLAGGIQNGFDGNTTAEVGVRFDF